MTTKIKILSEIEKNKNEYTSGSVIAEKLGISRNAVWKAIKALQNDGYNIEAVPNRGYKMTEYQDILTQESVRKYLNTKFIGEKIFILSKINSTNTFAKTLAQEGEKDGTLIIAEEQTQGRGRMGRSFQSPKGSGIYFSIILRPKVSIEYAPLITSCVAVAVCEALEKLSGAELKIKWVNDIFLNDKKICGILTEASIGFESGQLDYAIVGIGINLGTIKATLTDEILSIASSIEDEIGIKLKRSEVVAEIAKCIEKYIENLTEKAFMNDYRKRSYILGKRVIITKNNTEYEAQAIGIDDSACLIVKYDDGKTAALNSGEARIIAKSQ